MLPPLGPGPESRLRACASGVLLAAVLGAGMALAGTAAGAGQGAPPPPPEETAPPPAQTSPPPTTTPDDPPEPQSTTITLTVPAAPAVKPTQAVAAPRSAARTRERDRPRRTRSYAELAAPKATAKPKTKPARRAKQLPAAAPAPVTPRYAVVVRDSTRTSAVLGAQFPPQAVAASPPDRALYLLIALVCLIVCVVVAWAVVAPVA